jgi:hypothetical protein
MITQIVNVTNRLRIQNHFLVFDPKGREVGVQVSLFEFDVVPAQGDTGWSYRELGHYFYCDVQTTRNSIPFGACQPENSFKTEAERDTYIAKRVIDGKKNAMKKFK